MIMEPKGDSAQQCPNRICQSHTYFQGGAELVFLCVPVYTEAGGSQCEAEALEAVVWVAPSEFKNRICCGTGLKGSTTYPLLLEDM